MFSFPTYTAPMLPFYNPLVSLLFLFPVLNYDFLLFWPAVKCELCQKQRKKQVYDTIFHRKVFEWVVFYGILNAMRYKHELNLYKRTNAQTGLK